MKKVLAVAVVLFALGLGAKFYFGEAKKTSVVFVMIDTLRADHLGMYGYNRNTSPILDSFAKESIVFNYAVTNAPWTPPAVATMFTGLYPVTHGVIPPNSRELAQKSGTQLTPDLVTLSEVFKMNGYTTLGVSPNPWISEEFGFNQGFDSFWFKSRADAAQVNEQGLGMMKKALENNQPFFLYLHYLDPHDPYKPPQKYKDIIAAEPKIEGYGTSEVSKIDLYDAEIRYTDDKIGEVFAALKEHGIYDEVAIVVVADHGEQFMERGHQGHGFKLFDEELHVPFLFKPPHFTSGRRVDITASTIDIFPTVLAMANIELLEPKPGFSLLTEESISQRDGVFSEINRKINEQRSFTTPDGLKLILEYQDDGSEKVLGVFNSRKDPKEVAPIDNAELVTAMSSELTSARQFALEGRVQSRETARGQLKDSTIEQLKTLGYLQ